MKCEYCAGDMSDGANFCPICGRPALRVSPPEAQPKQQTVFRHGQGFGWIIAAVMFLALAAPVLYICLKR